MTAIPGKPMRDVLISAIYKRMASDNKIFFLSADMGAPSLDNIREDFKNRFINVGIAEQNMVNVAAGLAMEGFTVYTYAIAPFYLRALEQIRINLALPSQLREVNVNMLALGAGISYDVSGPTHHCLEDISIMRAMPGVMTISPGDWTTAAALVDLASETGRPKYFRLDGKALPAIYGQPGDIDFVRGFTQLRSGHRVCLVATGIMVHQALKVAGSFAEGEVGVVDVFMLDYFDGDGLARTLSSYDLVITLEEGFIGCGGLDMLVASLAKERDLPFRQRRLGMPNAFDFTPGDRFSLHAENGFGETQIMSAVTAALG